MNNSLENKEPQETNKNNNIEASNKPFTIDSCGQRGSNRSNDESRNTKFGEFPYFCSLFVNGIETCAATLISPRALLTTAQCIVGKRQRDLMIRCGKWNRARASNSEPLPHQERNVLKTISHPEYNSKTYAFDLGIIITSEEFQLGNHIQPICLPEATTMFNALSPAGVVRKHFKSFHKHQCFVTGWGGQNILQKFSLRIKPQQDKCASRFSQFGDSSICVEGGGCAGDSGMPLACYPLEGKDKLYLIGLDSYGATGCNFGNSSVPEVFANVFREKCWIEAMVACESRKPFCTVGEVNLLKEECQSRFNSN